MIVWPLRVVVLVAVVLAFLVARRAPQHRPIAFALGAALGLDVLRAGAELPEAVELALYPGAAALSVWMSTRLFTPIEPGAARVAGLPWIGFAIVAFLGDFAWSSRIVPPLALTTSVIVQAGIVWWWRTDDFAVRWTEDGPELVYVRRAKRTPSRPLTVSQACALVLLAGDAAGILGPAGPLPWPRSWWWLTAAQAALVALVLVGIQGAWLHGQRRGRRDP